MNSNKREQLDQRVRESTNLLAGIIGSAMHAIIAVDDAQQIVLFNAAAERVFACTANEAIGSSVERFIPERFRAGHSTRVRRFGESGVSNRTLGGLGTVWGLRATGEEFPIEASISKVESGGQKYFTVLIRDITDRKRAEEVLRETNRALEKQTGMLGSREELLKTFVKNVPAGVAMLDRDMRYLQVSDRWCADYGVDSSQVLGRSHYELFPDVPDRWKEVCRRALEGETLRADEDRWDRQGGIMWVRWEVRPLAEHRWGHRRDSHLR